MANNIIAEGVVSVGFDGSQVEAGVAKTTKSISNLASAGTKAGKDGAAGISKMADGASDASTKIDASTKRISRSIENTIAAAKAGSRGTAAFYESIANVRGANLDALRPYINQLKEVEAQAKQSKVANDKLATSARENSSNFSLLGSSIKSTVLAYASLSGVTAVAQLSDQYKLFNAQLKNATGSQAEFQQAFVNVNKIAQSAQVDVADLAKSYARFGNALKDVGATQKNISDLTETLSLALKVNGATTEEATSVMLQFSQALGKGKLDGDEFKSVMESAPNVMRELARSLNVPFGALKDLASQGKLTGDVLLKAFTNEQFLTTLRQQAEGMKTLSGGVASTKNEFLLLVGAMDRASGSSSIVNSLFDGINKRLTNLRTTIESGTFYEKYSFLLNTASGPAGLITAFAVNEAFRSGDKPQAAPAKESKLFTDALAGIKAQKTAAQESAEAVTRLKDSVKLYSDEVKKQKDIQSDANIALKSGAINQKDYDKIIRESNDTLEKLNGKKEKAAKLSSLQKLGLKMEDDAAQNAANSYAELLRSAEALTKPEQTQAEIVKEQADNRRDLNKEMRTYIDMQVLEAQDNEILKKLDDETNARVDQIEAIRQQAIELENENAGYGKLPSAITQVTIARAEDKKAILESLGLATDDIESEIAALKRLYIARAGAESNKANDERVKADKEANDKILKQHEDMANDINKSLTDALLRGFESGKSFAQNFRDTLKNMFKSLILQPIVKFLVDGSGITKGLSALGGLLGSNTASATSASSELVNTTGIARSLFDGLSGVQGSITSGIESLGAMLANGNGGFLDSVGGFLGANAGTIGNALPYAGAALQLLTGNIKGAAFTAAGAAIGSLIPGVGTVIGGAVGSLVGSLFGGNNKGHRSGAGVSGVYEDGKFTNGAVSSGTATRFNDAYVKPLQDVSKSFATQLGALLGGFGINSTITTYADFKAKQKGGKGNTKGEFSGSIGGVSFSDLFDYNQKDTESFTKYVDGVLGATLVKAIQSSTLTDGIKALFNNVTDKTQVTNLINASLSLSDAQKQLASRFGLTVDQAAQVSSATGLAGDSLAQFAVTLANSANAFKTVGESLTDLKTKLTSELGGNLPSTLQAFDDVLKGIDKTTQAGIESFTEMFGLREQFAAFTLSVDNLKGGVKSAIFSIVSDAEKQSMLNADLSKVFGDLGRDVPSSVQELIALGKTIDFTTKEGLDLASVFPSLVSAFVETKGAVNDLMNSLRDVNQFKTAVDFNRYKGIAGNYGNSFANNYVDGLTVSGAASNFTSNVNAGGVTASNNTTISTSDPNLLNAIIELQTQISLLKDGIDKTALHSKRAADVLYNVSPNGDAIRTEAA